MIWATAQAMEREVHELSAAWCAGALSAAGAREAYQAQLQRTRGAQLMGQEGVEVGAGASESAGAADVGEEGSDIFIVMHCELHHYFI